jgi:hypothetical protein
LRDLGDVLKKDPGIDPQNLDHETILKPQRQISPRNKTQPAFCSLEYGQPSLRDPWLNMEPPDNTSTPWGSWDDNFLESISLDATSLEGIQREEVHETAGGDPMPHWLHNDPTPDASAMPQLQHATNPQFNDFIPDLELLNTFCNIPEAWNPTLEFPYPDNNTNQDPPQPESAPMIELPSPSNSGGIILTPSSGEIDFNSSPDLCQNPYLSPKSLMESPQAYPAELSLPAPGQPNISPFTGEGFAPEALSLTPSLGDFNFNSSSGLSLMELPQVYSPGPSKFPRHQLNSSPYIGEGVVPEPFNLTPLSNVNPSPSQTNRTSRKHPRRVKNSPPGMKESGMNAYVFSHACQ